MPRKKDVLEKYEAGEAVPTQEIAAAYKSLDEDDKPFSSGLTVYAEFEYAGRVYKPGEAFELGALVLDEALMEFRGKTAEGLPCRAPDGKIVILPVR